MTSCPVKEKAQKGGGAKGQKSVFNLHLSCHITVALSFCTYVSLFIFCSLSLSLSVFYCILLILSYHAFHSVYFFHF